MKMIFLFFLIFSTKFSPFICFWVKRREAAAPPLFFVIADGLHQCLPELLPLYLLLYQKGIIFRIPFLDVSTNVEHVS